MGRVGPDTTELGYWSVAFCQSYLSTAEFGAFEVRGHSGGVDGVSVSLYLLMRCYECCAAMGEMRV